MITPKDIETKVFTTSIKGYRREEVDQFLDELMVEVQALLAENENLKSNIMDLRKEVENRKESESSIMRTLEQAKSLMSDISASAEKRADAIIRNAQSDAARIVQEAKESVSSMNVETDYIKGRLHDFKERYRSMLKNELKMVEAGTDDFFQERQNEFFPASMAESTPVPAEVQPVYQEPAFQQPVYEQQPGYEQPTFEQPVYEQQPGYEQPAFTQPVYQEEESQPGDDLLQALAEDFGHSVDSMTETIHATPEEVSTTSVDDMAATIVIDSAEMAKINGEMK